MFLYWDVQAAGAIAAALLLRSSLGDIADVGVTLPSGSQGPSFLWETVLSFFLMFVIMAVATDTRVVGEPAIAIGGTVGLDALFGGPISWASMNPARSLGPALVSGNLHALWLSDRAAARGRPGRHGVPARPRRAVEPGRGRLRKHKRLILMASRGHQALSEASAGTDRSLGPVAVRPELDAVAAELGERASRAGISISVEGDPSIELEMRPRMLRVVAQNLAENAIRYAGTDARFTLAVEEMPAGGVVLRGFDDGAGVAESELPRLFERFYRADRARASRGTGLGLAIVKHVVNQAGGSVEARGGRGAGLEVRCTFPSAL